MEPQPSVPRRRSPAKWIAAVVVAVVAVAAVVTLALPIFRGPAGPKVVTYATTSEMTTLDPSTDFSNSVLIFPNVYETLTLYDAATNTVKPLLATGWTKDASGTNWTFTLRQGVRFHDGTPFNATAVKFSIERVMRMNQGAAFIWTFPLNSDPNRIQVIDDFHVKFTTVYPAPLDAIAAADYGAYIISPKVAQIGDDNATANWFNDGHDAGTGPYTIATPGDWDKSGKARIVLSRFDGYWGGWKPGQFDKAIIRTIAGAQDRQLAVTDGDVDITIDVPIENVPALRNNPRVTFFHGPSYRALYALFNNRVGPLQDINLRRAVAYAIPYDQIITTVLGGLGSPPVGVIPATMFGYDASLPHFTYDLDKARQYKQAAANDGVCNPTCTLVMTHVEGDTFEEKTGQLMKDSLAQIGINLDVRPMTWDAQWGGAKSDPKFQDIFVMYWWPTYVTPYDFLFNMWHSEQTPNFNLGYYNSATFDSLIDEASALEATDRAAAQAKYSQAQEVLYNDAAGVKLFDLQNFYLYKSNLQGLQDNPAYPLVVFFYSLTRA